MKSRAANPAKFHSDLASIIVFLWPGKSQYIASIDLSLILANCLDPSKTKEVVIEFSIIPDNEALSKCAWCESHITDHMEVFGFGAKLKPDVDLSEYEGHCIQVGLVSEEKTVFMMVTAQSSEAKSEGKDGMFLVCSEKCGKKLKNVLEKEISSGKMFKEVWSD